MDVTVILSYYRQPQCLEKQLALWDDYPAYTRWIVVDDGTPEPEAQAGEIIRQHYPWYSAQMRCFRIHEDIAWNWSGARNLAAEACETEWMLMIDCDHMLSADAFRAAWEIVQGDGGGWHRLGRRYNGEALNPGPNIFFMRTEDFAAIGGYDEDLAGKYLQDRIFLHRAAEHLGPPRVLAQMMDVVSVDTHGLRRDISDADRTECDIRIKYGRPQAIERAFTATEVLL